MTNIPYLDEVWNLTRGCTKVSAGCKNCYAERIGQRFLEVKAFDVDCPITLANDDLIQKPLHWRKAMPPVGRNITAKCSECGYRDREGYVVYERQGGK